MKHLFAILAAILTCSAMFAQAGKDAPKNEWYEFKTLKEVPVTPVKNQYRSGTCWCFSTLGFVESEILRETGKEVDLSEMYVVSKSYHDRAVKYVRLDGALGFSAGSGAGDVLAVIRDWGLVPQDVMPGMQYGTSLPEQAELDAVLKAYVGAVVRNPNKTLTTAWLKGYDGILNAYLGETPESFEVDGKSFTPTQWRDALKFNPDDYVSITSFTHHPFYSQFVIEVRDNWRWESSYNLPLDEMMDVIYNAIDKGYTVAWGTDVSETGFTRTGLAVMPVPKEDTKKVGSDQEHWTGKALEIEAAAVDTSGTHCLIPEEIQVTQQMRQDGYDRKTTTDDHGMQIYGLAEDQLGNKYFLVKNSWGEAGQYKGIWYASDAFVRYKTINIIVHKDAIPKDIRKKIGVK
ncbi:MAG: C1 family peptidase [Bacteroidales bacterium]|nr:C1 family peptidase [Bacteroidales bacterium]